MSVLRNTGIVHAPVATVGAALRDVAACERSLTRFGAHFFVPLGAKHGTLFAPGDEIPMSISVMGLPMRFCVRVVRADADTFRTALEPPASRRAGLAGMLRQLRHETVLAPVGNRTLVTDSVWWKTGLGPLAGLVDTAVARRIVLNALAHRIRVVREVAEQWASRRIVVGAAIVHNGRLLAQQRHYPASAAGRWELPGGRVDAGESETDAVVRECEEELDVRVRPTGRIGTDVPLDNGMLLRIHGAELAEPSATPRAVEHRALQWVAPSELADFDWLDTDKLVLHSLHDSLRDD